MSKKTALGAAVALAVVAYGGATWYMGQRAQASYNEALEEVRKVLGAEAVVSQDYQKGFFSSQAKLVLQWTPPADADALCLEDTQGRAWFHASRVFASRLGEACLSLDARSAPELSPRP